MEMGKKKDGIIVQPGQHMIFQSFKNHPIYLYNQQSVPLCYRIRVGKFSYSVTCSRADGKALTCPN
jgi:hypothetical protein